MKWENFQESKTELPEVVVEKTIMGFSSATKDLVQLVISEPSEMARISNKLKTRFIFRLLLLSKKLPDYSFRVLEFGYDVDLYPVKVIINASILDELNNLREEYLPISLFENEDDFRKALELVFRSDRFKEIVSGLMKIASKQEISF